MPVSLPVQTVAPDRMPALSAGTGIVALVGNPNAGKTTLFNALTGLRAKTANFPGTTIEHRVGRMGLSGRRLKLVDLPGLYSLDAATSEERVARDALLGERPGVEPPEAIILLLDATNLERNLFLAGQVIESADRRGVPVVAALNQIDLAERAGQQVDAGRLSAELGCPVVPTVARGGRGVAELRGALADMLDLAQPPTVSPGLGACANCGGSCPYGARYDWAEQVGRAVSPGDPLSHGKTTEAIDRVLTHKVFGPAAFGAVMLAVFWMIFAIAQFPMGWIDALFGTAGELVASIVPAGGWWGDVRSLLVEGVIGGVGGMLVFLPQICILFFFLALLEDSGYMARAALIMDRLMHRVGLPGKAFVPLLSAHACAIPAIMSTRVIDSKRDRLVTMLVAPLMTCSARVPVYAMVVALLFADRPWLASLTFAGAYLLGVVAALVMAAVFKRTILRGKTAPLVIELPNYKTPSLKTALLLTLDRARLFVRKAGTVILVLSILLWALATYPKADPPAAAAVLETQAAAHVEAGDGPAAEAALAEADRLTDQNALDHSFAGMIGGAIEPVLRPLGFDERISVGVVMSFAAREVIVSTLAVLYGAGEEAAEEGDGLISALRASTRADGSPVFTTATCLSLLVFYVLAMQCLPTQAVTRRETGGWKWPAFQFGYMTVLAYGAALVTYQLASRLLA